MTNGTFFKSEQVQENLNDIFKKVLNPAIS